MDIPEGTSCDTSSIPALPTPPLPSHRTGLIEARKDGRWSYYRLAAKGASPARGETLRWVQKCLEQDPQILADTKRLKTVRQMDARKLCCHYHKEK